MNDKNKKGEPLTSSPSELETQTNDNKDGIVNLLTIDSKKFTNLYSLEISGMIEKRGHGSFQASYLSWANAIKLLRTNLPNFHVDFEKTEDGNYVHSLNLDGEPTYYLLPYLTDGKDRTPADFFPIMDNKFGPIKYPSVRDVNDSMQRAKAKAIATHTGIGLSCYIGEDVPSQDKIDQAKSLENIERVEPLKKPMKSFETGDMIDLEVPFKEKEECKNLGARWNKDRKIWQISADKLKADPDSFAKWVKNTEEEIPMSPPDEIAEQTAGDETDPDLDEDVPF
jgi:hypothetical protein